MKKVNKIISKLHLYLIAVTCTFLNFLITTLIVGALAVILYKAGIMRQNGRNLIILFIISCCITGTVTGLIVLNRPVKIINMFIEGMNHLSNGDFSYRITDDSLLKDSKPLIKSFNNMAEELENTDSLRSEFVNDISHEFKTPIVSIKGFAKLIKYADLSEEKRREYAGIIVEESDRLSRMSENILNLTRIENQTILTGTEEYNLSEQIRQCILELEKKWTEKNIEMMPDFGEYNIVANKEMLREVWINLIDNAVKFSDENEEIRITISKVNSGGSDGLEIKISDRGVKIKEEDLSRIFRKFYQADKSRFSDGTGTGLSVCKKIIELHNGKIWAKSNDSVTLMTVFLPLLKNY